MSIAYPLVLSRLKKGVPGNRSLLISPGHTYYNTGVGLALWRCGEQWENPSSRQLRYNWSKKMATELQRRFTTKFL